MTNTYKGDILQKMQVTGYHGGANGYFLGIIFADMFDDNHPIYELHNDYFGRLYFTSYKHKPPTQKSLTPDYDIKGAKIIGAQDLGNGLYRGLRLKNFKTNVAFVVTGPNQGIIEVYPEGSKHVDFEPLDEPYYGPEPPEYRKKKPSKSTKRKPKKVVKKCKCK